MLKEGSPMNLKTRLTKLEQSLIPIEIIDVDVKTLTDEELLSYKQYVEGQLKEHGDYDKDKYKYKYLTDQELEELIKQSRDKIKQHYPNVKFLKTLPDYVKKVI